MNYFSRVITMVKAGFSSAVILAEEKWKSCIKPPQPTNHISKIGKLY